MGGMYALLAACQCRGLSAATAFYGLLSHEHGILHAPDGLDRRLKPVQPLDAAPDLRCPLLAFFGDQDEFIPRRGHRAAARAARQRPTRPPRSSSIPAPATPS